MLTKDELKEKCQRHSPIGKKRKKVFINPADGSDIQRLLFAPNPETGFPCSQLPVELTKTADPEIREYVNKYLQAVQGQEMAVTDVREGFDSIVSRYAQFGSEVDDEIERLKGVVKESVKRNMQK